MASASDLRDLMGTQPGTRTRPRRPDVRSPVPRCRCAWARADAQHSRSNDVADPRGKPRLHRRERGPKFPSEPVGDSRHTRAGGRTDRPRSAQVTGSSMVVNHPMCWRLRALPLRQPAAPSIAVGRRLGRQPGLVLGGIVGCVVPSPRSRRPLKEGGGSDRPGRGRGKRLDGCEPEPFDGHRWPGMGRIVQEPIWTRRRLR